MGFLLLQLANFTYAAGQVMYKHLVARYPSDQPHFRRFGYFYLGALLVVLPAFLLFGKADFLPQAPLQWGVLVFLGLVSTALGMYWWNKGACLVNGGTLAVMNNLHVPVGLLLNLLIWNQHEPLGRLALGGLVILGRCGSAGWVCVGRCRRYCDHHLAFGAALFDIVQGRSRGFERKGTVDDRPDNPDSTNAVISSSWAPLARMNTKS